MNQSQLVLILFFFRCVYLVSCSHPDASYCRQLQQRALTFPGGEKDYRSWDEIRPRLFLGNVCGAHDVDGTLHKRGITHVLNMAKELSCSLEKTCRTIALQDNPHNETHSDVQVALEKAVDILEQWLDEGPYHRVFVHCNMGISRSSAAVVRYLQRTEGLSYEDALTDIRRKRPIVRPNRLYRRVLRSFDGHIEEEATDNVILLMPS